MTRKTGKALQKARQQMRAAKIARAKRELAGAGISLTFKRPPAHVMAGKGEELRKLYLEMFPEEVKKFEASGEEQGESIEEILPSEEIVLVEAEPAKETPREAEEEVSTPAEEKQAPSGSAEKKTSQPLTDEKKPPGEP
jgi:hypothetical protein